MKEKCEQQAEEQEDQLRENQKRARDTVDQCDDLLQGTVNRADEAAQKRRSLEASALGYDLRDLEKTMSPEVARALRTAYAEAEGCDHDYSFLCPFSWTEGSDGSTCTAPATYIGRCEKTQDFSLSKEEKQAKERECLVTWPCLKKCVRDYTQLCPAGWTEVGGGHCSAPFSYSGRCLRTMNFAELSRPDRERWSAACDAYWPCQAACKRDFSVPCPDGWTSIGGEGKCKAPEGYVGPCGPVESVGSLDSETKQLFEKKCNVLFPCESKCKRDYSFACPARWRNVALEKCSPGDSYAGPCRDDVDFASRTEQDKIAFEERCLADWPCIEEKCERDFTAPCPLEWAEAHKACMAPAHYKGPCEERQNFVGLTPEEKDAAMETCEVFWPCKGGEALLRDMVEGGPAMGRGVTSLLGGPVDSATGTVVGFVL
ncbi:UNVERIFIED_CONTAM: cpw-wpc domain-containing protein [Hammondia hammondi]|eukprot:XP_008883771.1 cpw-wpc domain-containing protein [Hammondia hammondi]